MVEKITLLITFLPYRTFGWSRTPGPSTGDSTDTFGWPGIKTTSAVSLLAPHIPSSNKLLVQTAKNTA